MASTQHLLDEIAHTPSGSGVGAFFDLDRTLIAGFSAQDILTEQVMSRQISLPKLFDGVASAVEYSFGRIEFLEFVNRAARDLGGRSEEENYEFGQRVFDKRVAQRIYPEARALVEAHRAKGHTMAVISSATPYQVEPVARDLGIEHVMCTRLQVENGICLGKVLEPACYGPGKAVAAHELAEKFDLKLPRSYFYSDGIEDLPLFEVVGNPRPLNPDAKLSDIARANGWPITRFSSRGTPSTFQIMRTTAAYSAAIPAAALSLTDYLFNGSAREARNLFTSLWGELASAAIDLKISVSGEQHLWSNRPAVFVFNHQSALDALVMVKLLRKDITSIAKKELASQPFIGQMASMFGTIFIDRANTQKAIEAMAPAVKALQSGTSVLIAPEGTRSVTNQLGAFKKGAFHLALQGGVPMIPVVIRNTTDSMPKGAFFARRGRVEVVVLPPIDTSSWSAGTIGDHVDEVRNLFLHELDQ